MPRAQLSKRDKDRLGIGLIVACVLVLGIAGTVAWSLRPPPTDNVDPGSLCAYDYRYPHTLILIDKTDPLSKNQQQAIKSLMTEVRGGLGLNEKLSIYVLDDKTYRSPVPAFAVCNPGSGKDANPLFQNPRQFERKYVERFGRPLEEALNPLLEISTAPSSPIMEMIQSVSWLPDFSTSSPRRRLIVVSDLMQHTATISHLKGAFTGESFNTSEHSKALQSDLKGVQVTVLYLLRAELHQLQSQRKHQDFWGRWFESNGATSIEFRRIP